MTAAIWIRLLWLARAKNHNLVADVGDNISWGSYISKAKLDKYHVIFSARDLLNKDPDVIPELNSEAVILGANWSTFAYDRAPLADLHQTPVGPLVGAVIHDNFAEALLYGHKYSNTPNWVLHTLGILFSLIAAAVFALSNSLSNKIVALIALSCLLVLIQWAALHGLGYSSKPSSRSLDCGFIRSARGYSDERSRSIARK